MDAVRTNRNYVKLPDTLLSRFGGGVSKGFTENAAIYDDPPVKPVDMDADRKIFDDDCIKAEKGGNLATAIKNASRAKYVDDLNKNAAYTDIKCDGDLVTLLLSGYEAVSTNRAQYVLDPPQITGVLNGQSGQLIARVKADPNVKSYVGRIKAANGTEYGPVISFKNSRSILFQGLTAGLNYVFQLCAIGGSTGQSDWSDPGTGMPR